MTEDEIGKMAASFVAKNIASLIDLGKETINGAGREVKLRLQSSYQAYLEETAQKYSQTKSFFIRNASVALYDFYVPIAIQSGSRKIDNPSFYNLTSISNRIAILGTGGCGKSILMKHLFIGCIATNDQVPIFIELRELNSKNISLQGLIEDALNSNNYSFDSEYINKAISKGHFAFILDGYDEVSNTRKKKLISEVKSLSKKGTQCSIIISSRPDDVFSGVDEFNLFKVQRLSIHAACNLVEKLPFDTEIKEKFLNELKNELFVKHQSFLSNPLLLSIMLLTYGQNAEIPTKLSIFYNQAYEVLFQRHDALKGGYKREKSTDLDIQDFSKVFSVFCLQTYDKRLFGVSRVEALGYIAKSKAHLSKDFSNESYLDDTLKATCLLIEDGMQIVFSHRSFQEYFVALYINSASPEVQNKLINKYWKNIRSDSVISLLFEMNQELVERLLIIPKLSEIFKTIGVTKQVGITHLLKFIKFNYVNISFDRSVLATLTSNEAGDTDILHFVISSKKAYKLPEDIDWKYKSEVLINKYGKKKGETEYKTSDLTYRHPLIQDLASMRGFLSIEYLQTAYNIFNYLQKKNKNIEASLDELLQL